MNDEQKVALITGASRGVGFETASHLLEHGWSVSMFSRSATGHEGLLEMYGGERVLAVTVDVRSEAGVIAGVNQTLAHFGKIDLVVANAGIGARANITEFPTDAWENIIATNLHGAFYTVKHTVPALIEAAGQIIVIGSLAAVHAYAGGAAYNASKFGLLGFTEAVMQDLRPLGVRVSTILPGSIATSFSGKPGVDNSWKIGATDVAETIRYLTTVPARTLPSRIELRPTKTGG